ncbi:MAG: (2Fe-2S)-binding protein [candidate division WOR-3 bacterium]|nr:MAG: (2Fe-2S)-binding protein [candidate division WOR-3 bacterium]
MGGKTRRTARKRTAKKVTVVCRCEEVTEDEIRRAIREGHQTLEQIKRKLRTGMGHCQGRGCLRIIAQMVEEETGFPASEQKLPTSRPPLKPLPLDLLARYDGE